MPVFVLLFLPRELSFGRGSTAPVGGGAFPSISTREPWDGKDGEVSPGTGTGGRMRGTRGWPLLHLLSTFLTLCTFCHL